MYGAWYAREIASIGDNIFMKTDSVKKNMG